MRARPTERGSNQGDAAGIGEREQRLTLGLRLEESPSGQFLARFLQPILPNSFPPVQFSGPTVAWPVHIWNDSGLIRDAIK